MTNRLIVMDTRAQHSLRRALWLLLLVAAGLTGIITLKNVNSGYKVDVGLDNRARATAAMILVDMLQARQSEKDFFLSRDLTYFESGRRYLDKALADAEILSHLVTNSDVRSKLKEIKVATAGYRGSFVALVEAYRLRGLTEETGLLADFQQAANHLQQFMSGGCLAQVGDTAEALGPLTHSGVIICSNKDRGQAPTAIRQSLLQINP